MKWISPLVIMAGVFWISSVSCLAQPAAVKGSLDELIDWSNPWGLTQDKVKAVAEAAVRKKSDRPYNARSSGGNMVVYGIGERGGGDTGSGNLSLFAGKLDVSGFGASFTGDQPTSLSFSLGSIRPNGRKASAAAVNMLKAELNRLTGDAAPRPCEIAGATGRPPIPGLRWVHAQYKVELYEVPSTDSSGRKQSSGVHNVVIEHLGR